MTVTVTRFDGIPGKNAELKVNWSLIRGQNKKVKQMRKSSFHLPPSEPGHGSLDSLQSRLITAFSRKIAQVMAEDAGN